MTRAGISMVLGALAVCEVAGAEAAAGIRRFDAAEFVLRAGPQGEAGEPRGVALPDDWSRTRPGVGGIGRYRIRFQLSQQPQQPQAVFIRRVSAQGRVFLNGHYLGGGELQDQDRPVRNFGNRAQLFVATPPALVQGENLLEIQVQAFANFRGGLSAVELGPESALRPIYERRYLVQTIGPLITSSITGAIALFALSLWTQRRADRIYGFFGAAALIWALRNLNLFMVETWLPAYVWMAFAMSGNGLFFIFFAFFVLRYTGTVWPWFERALWALAAIGPLSILAAGWSSMHPALVLWGMVLLPLSLLLLAIVLAHAWRTRAPDALLIAASFALYVVFNLADWTILRGLRDYDALFVSHYTGLVMFLAVSWMLNRRFVGALDEVETLNIRLEQRVTDRGEQLRLSYERLQQAERRNAAYMERQEIVRDMHDGLGAHLVSMLHLARGAPLAPAEITLYVQECLDELRLTIDALSPQESDLVGALAALRHRFEPRLHKAGIALGWEIGDIPENAVRSPHEVLQITRIVLEALSNSLKHSRADSIAVRMHWDAGADTLRLMVADSGRGFDPDNAPEGGRGLENMRQRAASIGAELKVETNANGTKVLLALPRIPQGLAASS